MKKNNRKKWIAAATALAAVGVLVGTFAWFTSNDRTVNSFEGGAAGNDVEIVENFTPPTDWKPGQSVTKEVGILNTGEYASFVRVSLEGQIKKLPTLANPTDSYGVLTADPGIITGVSKDEIYVYTYNGTGEGYTPVAADQIQYTALDGTIKTGEPTFTIQTVDGDDNAYAGKYTLKILVNGNQYSAYWINGTTNVKYYAKINSYEKTSAGKLMIQGTPQYEYIDLSQYVTQDPVDWTKEKPTVAVDQNGEAIVDSKSDANIKIHFVNLRSTPTENYWFYNAADGYFYYVGKLDSQQKTPLLIDKVTLSQDADNSYTKVKYDLTVKADGIQADKGAAPSEQWVSTTNNALANILDGLANVATATK